MTKTDEYDPAVHVTAKELRNRGFKIPDTIPDVAWIREGAWTLVSDDVSVEKESSDDGDLFKFHLGSLVYLEPFRWWTMRVKTEPKEKL